MANGYTRSHNLLKGALIQFSAPMLVPIPNIILFQYNPESMTRTLTPWLTSEQASVENAEGETETVDLAALQTDALSQPYDPAETFSLVLELDATDALESPDTHPVAVIAGVADRIAALEMLCYPSDDGDLGTAIDASVGAATAAATGDLLARKSVPIVLFFWGPGRIVPVRITTFSVEEQQYSPLLYPVRAKVTVGLKVLDENHLVAVAGKSDDDAALTLAKACYQFTLVQKKALALANLANSVESVVGMLPI